MAAARRLPAGLRRPPGGRRCTGQRAGDRRHPGASVAVVADVLIDLDRPDPHQVTDGGPPWTRPTPRQLRVVLSIVVLLVAAFTVGAAGPARPARFAGPLRIPDTGSDEFLLAGDIVAMWSPRSQQLLGYGLDGSVRWAVPMPIPRADLAAVAGDTLLVVEPMWPGRTAAVDRVTGALRWNHAGMLQGVAGDTVVLGVGPPNPLKDSDITELIGYDANTGDQRFAVDVAMTGEQRALDVFTAGYKLAGRGRVGPDGTGELLDLTSGRWRTLTGIPSLPETATPQVPGRYQVALRVDELTVIVTVTLQDEGSSEVARPTEVIAYGPSSGSPMWTAKAAGSLVAVCGSWLCLADADTTRVLDRATGVELRRVDWPHVVAGSDRRFLGYDTAGAVATTQVAVFDAETGRRIALYTGWDVVSVEYAEWLPLVRRSSGLTWELASLSLTTGTAYPLGTFESAGERACQTNGTHVACSVRSGEVLVWRHAPPR
jgi:hypothetical protein